MAQTDLRQQQWAFVVHLCAPLLSQSSATTWVALLIALVGCADRDPSVPRANVLVRDSAGIQLVHNLDASIDTASTTLTERLRIGVLDGPEVEQFFRITGLTVSENRTIYISNWGSSSVRVFSASGQFLREIGRKGSGPGEFDRPAVPVLWRDTLFVSDGGTDFARLRGALYDTTGTLVGTTRSFMSDASRIEPVMGTPQGWLVVHQSFMRSRDPKEVGQEVRDTLQVRLLPAALLPRLALMSAAQIDSALTVVVAYEWNRMFSMMAGEGIVMNAPMFEPRARHAFGPDGRIYIARGWPYSIDVYDVRGRLIQRISRAHTALTITEDHVSEVLARAEAYYTRPNRRGGDYRDVIKKRAGLPRVGFLPVTERVLVDLQSGSLWVKRVDVTADPAGVEWTTDAPPSQTLWDVFDARGIFQHMVRLPPRFMPHSLRSSVIYGVLRDDHDVEYVVAYQVGHPGGPRDPG